MISTDHRAKSVRPACALLLMFVLTPALAERPVLKNVDAWGSTSYSDRPSRASSTPVRNRIAPEQSAARYDAAVVRAESDRLALQRTYAENGQPRKIAIYDPAPGYSQSRSAWPGQAPSPARLPRRSRWDPNLPLSPAPSLERNYYYNGR